jgi:thiol-disulfide isomerase/thioredoxin
MLLSTEVKSFSATWQRKELASSSSSSRLFLAEETKAAPLVSGEELELMLQDWDLPLLVDAYATWCGPCLLMAPEFEAAAQELKGKVRLVKLDTDKDEAMAARLNIMGLPTLLFLDKYVPEEGKDEAAQAQLLGRIEGAVRKQNILDLCEFYFFGGPEPSIF